MKVKQFVIQNSAKNSATATFVVSSDPKEKLHSSLHLHFSSITDQKCSNSTTNVSLTIQIPYEMYRKQISAKLRSAYIFTFCAILSILE